ncbi:MAG TPA: DUF1223 domain-containing protein [Thermoanaerobaculia bacterium]|nr:DUF1223 domain-containing protein [Thermoanaerobaculia bacterium]
MSNKILLALPILAGLSVLAALSRSGSAAPQAAANGGPIVLELFTSQGCSSCPPADRLLTRLSQDSALAGRVIPLSFHVDYWDYIGWQDPFDSPRWSERQRAYAQAFRSNRIYTPQLVINGKTECVGSQELVVRQQIASALAAPPAGRVTLDASPDGAGDRLRVRVGAEMQAAAGGDLDLWVAVWETGLATRVGAGENASKTLRNDYVVRRLEKAFTLAGKAGARESTEMVLGLDKRWKRENLGVAAFLQDPATRVIYGAASQRLGG